MGRASHNVLINHRGRLAVQAMQAKLDIPYCFAPVAYGIETIAQNYRTLGEFLGVTLHTERYCEEAQAAIQHYQQTLGPLTVAIDSTVNARPFELARALTEYGLQVRYVFANDVLEFDLVHVEWLKCHAPDIKVFTTTHPTMADFRDQGLSVDLAVGFAAGYYCAGAPTVPLSLNSQPYGYRGVISLFRELLGALDNPQRHREQVYALA